jgi:hypothetical protein
MESRTTREDVSHRVMFPGGLGLPVVASDLASSSFAFALLFALLLRREDTRGRGHVRVHVTRTRLCT